MGHGAMAHGNLTTGRGTLNQMSAPHSISYAQAVHLSLASRFDVLVSRAESAMIEGLTKHTKASHLTAPGMDFYLWLHVSHTRISICGPSAVSFAGSAGVLPASDAHLLVALSSIEEQDVALIKFMLLLPRSTAAVAPAVA